jgi:hypothetical protein
MEAIRNGTKVRLKSSTWRTGIVAAKMKDKRNICVIFDGDEHLGPQVVPTIAIEIIPGCPKRPSKR